MHHVIYKHCIEFIASEKIFILAASGQVSIVLRIIEVASRQRHYETARDAQLAAKAVQNMLNARNSTGQSSLMLACRHGYGTIALALCC